MVTKWQLKVTVVLAHSILGPWTTPLLYCQLCNYLVGHGRHIKDEQSN
jgi:hypothetical protein